MSPADLQDIPLDGPAILPRGDCDSLVVFLHGYGSNGDDLISLGESWAPLLPRTAFIAPHAPDVCDAWAGGYQWFPIRGVEAGVTQAALDRRDLVVRPAKILSGFLDAQLARFGLDDRRLVVAGFSQGAMMAMYAMPRRARACAGVIAYSGLLVDAEGLRAPGIVKMPMLVVHGAEDSVVPPECLDHAQAGLTAAGFEVEADLRPGLAHGIDPVGLRRGFEFVQDILP